MLKNIAPVSFGAIKGIARTSPKDKTGDIINIPDWQDLTITEKDGKMILSSDPSKAYALVQLDKVEMANLILKNKARVNIDTVGYHGFVKQEDSSSSVIGKLTHKATLKGNSFSTIGEITGSAKLVQMNNSHSDLGNVRGSVVLLSRRPDEKSVATIEKLSGNLETTGDSVASIMEATHNDRGAFRILQKDDSKSYISKAEGKRDINNEIAAEIELQDRAKSKVTTTVKLARINPAGNSEFICGAASDAIIDQRDRSRISLTTLLRSLLTQNDSSGSKISYTRPDSTINLYADSQTEINSHEGRLYQNHNSRSSIETAKKDSYISLEHNADAQITQADKGSKIKKDRTATFNIDNDFRSLPGRLRKLIKS